MRQELREKKMIYKATIIVYIYTVIVTILKIYIYLPQLMWVILRLECVNLIYSSIIRLPVQMLLLVNYILEAMYFFFFLKQVSALALISYCYCLFMLKFQ